MHWRLRPQTPSRPSPGRAWMRALFVARRAHSSTYRRLVLLGELCARNVSQHRVQVAVGQRQAEELRANRRGAARADGGLVARRPLRDVLRLQRGRLLCDVDEVAARHEGTREFVVKSSWHDATAAAAAAGRAAPRSLLRVLDNASQFFVLLLSSIRVGCMLHKLALLINGPQRIAARGTERPVSSPRRRRGLWRYFAAARPTGPVAPAQWATPSERSAGDATHP
jgi:hypothetical protein